MIGLVAEVGKDYEIDDRAPLSLGIEIEGGVMMTVRKVEDTVLEGVGW